MVKGPSGLLTCLVRLVVLSTEVLLMKSGISKILTLLLIGWLAVVWSMATVAAKDPNKTLLVIGDSLSAGLGVEPENAWVSLLDTRLNNQGYKYNVVNASITGDTTGGGLRRLARSLKVHQPSLIIIELGGNDGLRGLPIPMIRKNLAEMIKLSRKNDARVILAGMKIPPNYGETYTTAFSNIYPELAKDLDVALIEFFMKGVALNPDFMQRDGIHPNDEGQPQLLDNVWQILLPLLQSD